MKLFRIKLSALKEILLEICVFKKFLFYNFKFEQVLILIKYKLGTIYKFLILNEENWRTM